MANLMDMDELRKRNRLQELLSPLMYQEQSGEGVASSAPPVVTSPGLRQIGAETQRPIIVSGEDLYAEGVPDTQTPSNQEFGGIRPRPEVPPMERTEYKPIDVQALRRELYTPQTAATERFNRLLDTTPERGRPSIARRIAASASMFGGDRDKAIERGEQFMYAPYNREMADWTAKVDPYGKAAQFENTANVNERTLATQIIQREQENERLRQAERKIDISQQAQRLREMKYRNPDLKFDFSGPYVMVSDPSTGETRSTGVKTGEVDEMTRIDVTGAWRVKAAQEAGANALERVRVQQAGQTQRDNPQVYTQQNADGSTTLFEIKRDAQGNPIAVPIKAPGTGPVQRPGTPPRSTAASRENELNLIRERNRKAKELRDFDKELGAFITINRDGSYKVATQGMFGRGPSDEQLRRIKQYIGVPENEPVEGTGTITPSSAVPPNATDIQRNPATGKRRYSTDGKPKDDPTKVWIEVESPQGRAVEETGPEAGFSSPNMARGRNPLPVDPRYESVPRPYTPATGTNKGRAASVAEGGQPSTGRGTSASSLALIAEEEERRRQARR